MKNTIIRDCLRIAEQKNNPDDHPQYGFFHHYSFIIQDNKIIEWGMNRDGSPFIHGYHDSSKIHSEVDAFRKARGLLDPKKPFEILNIRLNKTNQLRNSKPCKCCFSFIKAMGASKIYFSTDVGIAKIV